MFVLYRSIIDSSFEVVFTDFDILTEMDGYMSPSQMPRNNLVPTDSLLKTTSIWTEAISGKSSITEEQVRQFEQKKREYINSLKHSGSDEDLDVCFGYFCQF